MSNSERILLCKPRMCGREIDFIRDALADDWAVPLGPDCDAFEHELEAFVNSREQAAPGSASSDNSDNSDTSDWSDNSESSEKSESSERSEKSERSASSESSEAPDGAALPPFQRRVASLISGTAAVHLALIACGVGPGDEVIVQSFTFCASSHPVTYLGATPVFVDSEPQTWNMDPDLLEEAIKDRIARTRRKPKAIIPVALYGMPYQIDRIMAMADRYGIPVIEDAAEGFGSRFRGQVLGTFGRFGVLSFNGNKMITTSGGGALICPDAETRERIMWYATQARESYPYYQHEAVGYNYRMSNICACIGRGQMTVLDEHIAHHRHIQALYRELLADVDGLTLHEAPSPDYDSNYWLCTVTIDPGLRIRHEERAYRNVITGAVGGAAGVTHAAQSAHTDLEPNRNVEALRLCLNDADIESRPLWKPMHTQPVYRHSPAYVNGVSERLFRTGLCLPSGPHVTDAHIHRIVTQIISAIR